MSILNPFDGKRVTDEMAVKAENVQRIFEKIWVLGCFAFFIDAISLWLFTRTIKFNFQNATERDIIQCYWCDNIIAIATLKQTKLFFQRFRNTLLEVAQRIKI